MRPVMNVIGLLCLFGLFVFALGVMQQIVSKENRKLRNTLYVILSILFVVSLGYMLAKNT
jgi:uncharacterized membrane protein HdeD (DUF308 family)